ncbi:hypothetical protein TRFO_23188 [Tritrichomonas foetus]|uniref:Tubby C-terminal domain-containing protein n=1 Tax=Tritrichomonas foetus TaxID=1144522 RepID=A0A1J4KF15_9EUKA|nr:hypothetical protein TRFO_23188 [Tritrichomonas foetus]|eukprot:OHT08356.1 hypothetical protein TRFO_23188 [Tritrichomonas foetus]
MKTAKKSPKIDALKTTPKYNPRPPNCPKSPIQLDKITPKNGELKNEESKNEEFNNLYNSDNNSSKNKSILDQNENGTSVSQAKKKIIRNRSNNNVASLLKDIDVSKLPKKRFTFMKQILSTFNKNKFSLTMSREEGEPFSTIVDLREQTLEFTHESNYIITLNKEKNEFILKKNNSKCDDLCSIKYQIEKEPVKHKKCMITFLFDIIGISSPLQNIPPKIKDGKICLDFNDENVIPSVKNMIFQDSCQNELITIVRTSKTTLSITSIPIIPDEIIFFIGFSSFADHTS